MQVNDTFTTTFARGDTLFVATAQSGLWYSVDLGLKWQQSNIDVGITSVYGTYFSSHGRLFFSFQTANQAGIFTQIYHSPNGISSWQKAATIEPPISLRNVSVWSLHSLDSTIFGYALALSALPPFRYFQYQVISKDIGRTWSLVPIDTALTLLTSIPFPIALQNTTVYRGQNNIIQRSLDTGRTWQRFGRGDSIIMGKIENLIALDTILLATTTQGTYRIGNNEVWQESGTGLSFPDTLQMQSSSKRIIAFSPKQRLYSSVNTGLLWQQIPLPQGKVISSVVGTNLCIVAVASDNTLWRTLDDGRTWQTIHQTIAPQQIELVTSLKRDVYIAAQKRGILFAQDSTSTFLQLARFQPLGTLTNVLITNGINRVVAGRYSPANSDFGASNAQYVYFQNNDFYETGGICTGCRTPLQPIAGLYGSHVFWFPNRFSLMGPRLDVMYRGLAPYLNDFVTKGLETSGQRHSLLPFNIRLLLAGTDQGIYRSQDSGSTWQQTFSAQSVYAFATIGTVTLAGTNNGIYRSSDSGQTWQQSGMVGISVRELAARLPNAILARTTTNGVFLSNDVGRSWQTTNTGLPSVSTASITLTERGIGYAIANGELYRTQQTLVSVRKEPILSASNLLVFPNPSVEQVSCRYTVTAPGMVRISLMNTLGQIIRSVEKGYQNIGEHTIVLDIENIPQGVYWVVLETPVGYGREKVVVVR